MVVVKEYTCFYLNLILWDLMFRKIFYLCSYCCWRILPGISWYGSHWRRASSALTRSNFNMWVSICGFPYLNCSIWVLICDFQKASCQIRALKCESDVWIYLIYVNVSFNIWILIRELQYVNEWFYVCEFYYMNSICRSCHSLAIDQSRSPLITRIGCEVILLSIA